MSGTEEERAVVTNSRTGDEESYVNYNTERGKGLCLTRR